MELVEAFGVVFDLSELFVVNVYIYNFWKFFVNNVKYLLLPLLLTTPKVLFVSI